MKRYLFFVGTLGNGGAERVISILASRMAEQGMNVEVLTYYDRPVFYDVNPMVKITSVERCTGKNGKLANLLWIRKYFKEHAKAVLSFLAPFNILAIAAVFGTKVPIIVADRNDPAKVPTNRCIRKLRDILYLSADHVVLQTEKNKAYFSRKIQEHAAVIYNPVDLKEMTGTAIKTKKEKLIVSAGRLMKQKNQKLMIDAFAETVKKHPEYKLVIYGEGPYRAELEKIVQEKELQGQVLLPGNYNDIHEKIRHAEIFVLSSDYEGMPNALIEAMCLGLPVISTKVSGAADLIEHGKNGLLVDVGDVAQMEAAMNYLIENDAMRMRLEEEAVKLSVQLSTDHILKQWLSLIDLENRGE